MKDWAIANGQSRRAAQILDEANFRVPARESVLVQSYTSTFGDQAFASAVAGVIQTLVEPACGHERRLADRPSERRSDLRRPPFGARAVRRQGQERGRQGQDRTDPRCGRKAQAGNPSLIVEEFGQASSDHQLDQRFANDMHRAEVTSVPLTLAILVVAFGALVAAGLPVVLAFSAVLAATGLNSA